MEIKILKFKLLKNVDTEDNAMKYYEKLTERIFQNNPIDPIISNGNSLHSPISSSFLQSKPETSCDRQLQTQ